MAMIRLRNVDAGPFFRLDRAAVLAGKLNRLRRLTVRSIENRDGG